MQPSANEPRPGRSLPPDEFPSIDELLQHYSLEQILYGIHIDSEGAEEISYVETEPLSDGPANPPDPDAPPPSAPPPGASST
jgi:hypothetical protein